MATPGMVRPLGKVAMDLLSDSLDALYQGSKDYPLWSKVADVTASMARDYRGHPNGPTMVRMINKGVRIRQQAIGVIRKPITDFEKVVSSDPQLALKHNYKKDTLGQIYSGLPQNHPGELALRPLMSNPKNGKYTIEDMKNIMISHANAIGVEQSLGPHSIYLANLLEPMLTGPDPVEYTRAMSWMNNLSQIFNDTTSVYNMGSTHEESKIKMDVSALINQPRVAANLKPITIDTTPQFEKGGMYEKIGHKYVMNNITPWIGIVHIGDLMKLPANLPARVLWKTLTTFNEPQLKDMVMRSGALTHTILEIVDADFRFRTSALADVTKMPDAAALIHKMWHQPGFNNLRKLQINIMGAAAYHAMQEWSQQALRGNEWAIENLKEVEVDINDLIRRNGVLTQDEMLNGMYHYTDNRLYIDRPLDRTKYAGKSPFFRTALMLHGYARKEGIYIGRELHKMIRTGEGMKVAQFAAVVAGVYPFVTAPLLRSLGVLARTADPKAAYDDYTGTYHRLSHPGGAGNFALEYATLLAHFGGMGNFMNMLHAAHAHKLAYQMAGPFPGVVYNIGDDLLNAAQTELTSPPGKKKDYTQFYRDILRYSIPVLGSQAAHWLLPKRQHLAFPHLPQRRRIRRR
ncbi:MAG TPA: hypothetical protein VII99_08800 [Bacteroidia bacterium]